MKKKFSAVIVILTVVLVMGGCSKENSAPQDKFFNISSLVNYNNSLCAGTGFNYRPNGFNSGLKIIFKDLSTGEIIQGYATASTINGGGSLSSDSYSCEEGIDSQDVLVSAYAKGYSPIVFMFKYPINQLATINVLMPKSCSGGPSYFDNLNISSQIYDNQTYAKGYISDRRNNIYQMLKEQFALNEGEYSLQCVESDDGRGGYIKAKGIIKDDSSFELFYHWGWCSSGGQDCGWSECFSSNSSILIESLKNITCNKLSSRQSYDGSICTSLAFDNTTEVQDKCYSGNFEKTDGTERSLSIIQSSNRCGSSVSVGEFNCLDN